MPLSHNLLNRFLPSILTSHPAAETSAILFALLQVKRLAIILLSPVVGFIGLLPAGD